MNSVFELFASVAIIAFLVAQTIGYSGHEKALYELFGVVIATLGATIVTSLILWTLSLAEKFLSWRRR